MICFRLNIFEQNLNILGTEIKATIEFIFSSSYGGGYNKSGASMSALTLLAFLFFLHILQQCIKDHMTDMSATQPVVVMTAGRESDDIISKSDTNKIDKTGINEMDEKHRSDIEKLNPNIQNKISDVKNAYDYSDSINKKQLMKVHTTNYEKSYEPKFQHAFNTANRSSYFPGFVSAMDEK